MAQKVGELTGTGTLDINDVRRHEHHKITVVVSSYVSTVTLKIEDISINDSIPINLHGSNNSFTLSADGGNNYLIENEKFEKLRVNFVSGDATLTVYYTGW